MRYFLALLVLMICAVPAFADHAFYVSPTGNDAWSGTLPDPAADGSDGPWQTLGGARDNLRALRTSGAMERRVLLNLRAGEYVLTEPLQLGVADSGKPGAPVVWRSAPGEQAVLSGGVVVSNWDVTEGVWVADISAHADAETGAPSALWINGERRTPARTPNEGYFLADGKADPALRVDMTAGRSYDNHAFAYTEGFEQWPDIDEALVSVYHAWEVSYHRIADLNTDQKTVQFVNDAHWPFGQWGREQRYYIENVRAALDQPGEWYVNRAEGKLYYLPMPGETPENTTAIIPAAMQLLLVDGDPDTGTYAEFLQFERLAFRFTDWPIGAKGHSDAQAAHSVPAAVQWKFTRYSAMTDCEIAHTGGYAFWLDAGCQQNRIQRNNWHDLGAGGVRVGGNTKPVGTMSAADVVASRNTIDNNWIHDGGKIYQAGVGVWIGHANYITLSHNEIADFYYSGVSNGWVWGYGDNPTHHNIIEFNHIHHLGKRVLSDMGGVYNLGIQPGTIVRNNSIHDVYSFQYGGWGLYTDEGSTEILLENNIVYNTTNGGFHQHYGENNRVRNNIFAFSDNEQIAFTRVEEHRSLVFERNIVVGRNGRITPENWNKADIWSDYNVYWDVEGNDMQFGKQTLGQCMAQGRELNSVVADPMFTDLAAEDFSLQPDSPALALGFEPIDESRIGLYGDPAWVNAPKE
ncbi:MAG: right-handed parallel beta-helix repeat-containing protein [Candidatus Hydrogenedens sp.]|nr:right-handed parallel beta-helix repeat-containing protein [Candidatus Hydrogenedens sp.]